MAAVRQVRGRVASWFVLGSNDYFAPRPLNYLAYLRPGRKRRRNELGRAPELVERLVADGWQDLTNVRRALDLDGLPIELLGLDDAHIRWHDLRVAPREEPERFGIAVMHSPDSAPEAASLGYRFMVAGHTHGGQVCVPFGGAIVTNCSMPRRLVSGVIRMGGAVLHTSPGLGTSKYAPFRFACRPEATLLELRRVATLGEVLGTWRSLVARSVRDAEVAGSNPAVPTRTSKGGSRAIRPSSGIGRGGRHDEGVSLGC